jgi:hypothetical protein
MAMIKSSAILHQAEEIWVGIGGEQVTINPITSYNKWLEEIDITTSLFSWNNGDTALQGTITYPQNHSSTSKSLPTIMLIHCGPYSRTTPDFNSTSFAYIFYSLPMDILFSPQTIEVVRVETRHLYAFLARSL